MLYVALLKPAVVGIDKLGCGEGPCLTSYQLLKYVCISWCKLQVYSPILRSFPPPVFDRLQYANMEGKSWEIWSRAMMVGRHTGDSVQQRISKPSCLTVLPPHGYSWLGNQFIVCIMHLKATLNIWCGWGSIAKHYCFSCNRAAHLSPTHTRKKRHCVPHEWFVMAGHYVMLFPFLRETDSNWTDWWTRSPPREETSKDYNRYMLSGCNTRSASCTLLYHCMLSSEFSWNLVSLIPTVLPPYTTFSHLVHASA